MKTMRKLICVLITLMLVAGLIPVALAEGGNAEVKSLSVLKQFVESGDYSNIKLTGDITDGDSEININSDLTLDLNGFTLNIGHSIVVNDDDPSKTVTVTIKDGSPNGAGKLQSKLYSRFSSNITILGGTVTTILTEAEGVNISIKGGKVVAAPSDPAIRHMGTGSISIEGGSIISDNKNAIVSYASTNVSGGYIKGEMDLNGTNELSGGFYTVNPETKYKASIKEGYSVKSCTEEKEGTTYSFAINDKPDPKQYVITAGEESYTKGSGKTLTFTCNGPLDKFEELTVNGNAVDKDNMDVKQGSTIVTLKNSYLEKLSIGKHEVQFMYQDGESDKVSFTINPAPEPSPETGDETPIMIFSVLAVISILGIAVIGKKVWKNQ